MNHRGDCGSGIRCCARDNIHGPVPYLCVRIIDNHSRVDVEPVLLYDADHAGDRSPGRIVASTDTLADRIAMWPKAISHLLIDDRDWRHLVCVSLREHAPANEWNLHRAEIGRCSCSHVDL